MHAIRLISPESAPFHFPNPMWALTLRLAVTYGWTPIGAVHDDLQKRTCYCRPLGQYVTAADARELAAAVERALPDMPDEDIEMTVDPSATLCTVPLFNIFCGRNKRAISTFIEFCRQGGFAIH